MVHISEVTVSIQLPSDSTLRNNGSTSKMLKDIKEKAPDLGLEYKEYYRDLDDGYLKVKFSVEEHFCGSHRLTAFVNRMRKKHWGDE